MMRLAGQEVVVTGGAGAIGCRLVRQLLQEGVRVIHVIDDLSSGHAWLLPADPRVVLHEADVCDVADLLQVETGAVVFHLAAFFANQNSVDHPQADLHTNGLGTLNVLQWAMTQQARVLIYASAGCSIAGHEVNGPIREDMPVSMHLSTPYQITKALGEFYCNYFQPHLPSVRCRFFNSYGPGEVPGPYRNVIPNFIWRALHDEPLVITGTGEETRDFVYVDDLVDGLVRCAVQQEAWGQAINLGTGFETRVQDLAELIIAACGSRSRVEYTARRAWDHSIRRQADIGRARALLEFSPQRRLADGLRETVVWFQENRAHIASAEGVLT